MRNNAGRGLRWGTDLGLGRAWRQGQASFSQGCDLAGFTPSASAILNLAHMAQAWLRLADNCQDAKKVRPAVQQQQQIQPKSVDQE